MHGMNEETTVPSFTGTLSIFGIFVRVEQFPRRDQNGCFGALGHGLRVASEIFLEGSGVRRKPAINQPINLVTTPVVVI